MLAQKSDLRPVRAPHHVLHRRAVQLRDRLLLLDIIQHDRTRRAEDQTGRSTVEDLVSLHRRLDRLDDRVREISDFDELFPRFTSILVQEDKRKAEETHL